MLTELVPRVTAGIRSIRCECGWESVFLVPEEQDTMIVAMFEHLTKTHEVVLPKFSYVNH